jgi:putative two-component system response regulator
MMVIKKQNQYMTKTIKIDKNYKRKVTIEQNDENMKFLSSKIDENDTYNPTSRPWYKLAVENKKLSWTDPYVFFTLKTPGITTSVPVYDKSGELKGVIGVDIKINELSKFISNLKISKNSKVFMLDNNLKVIAFPDKKTIEIDEKLKKARVLELNEIDDMNAKLAYKKLLNSINGDSLEAKKFLIFKGENGKKYYSLFLPFDVNNIHWTIGMYAPEDDYLGILKQNQQFIISISVIIGIFAILFGFFIAKYISKPIKRMQNMAHELNELNLNTSSVESSIFYEIDETIDTFNTMKDSLKNAYNDTIFRLAVASEYNDENTAEHIKRVGEYSVVIGKGLGLTSDELYVLEQASIMHDIES